jgi:hypothetical protein
MPDTNTGSSPAGQRLQIDRCAIREVLLGAVSSCKPAEFQLLYWLLELAQGKSWITLPGMVNLADVCGLSANTVRRRLTGLLDAGLIDLTEQLDDKGRKVQRLVFTAQPKSHSSREGKQFRAVAEMISGHRALPPGVAPVVEPTTRLPRTRSLTELDMAKISSSVDVMKTYLLYGVGGVRSDDRSRISSTNWQQFGGNATDPKISQWKATHFAGYYWYRVSVWRAQQPQPMPLVLPVFRKLAGVMRTLLQSMTRLLLFARINFFFGYFELLQFKLGPRIGATLVPDEVSLLNALVKNQLDGLMNLADTDLEDVMRQAAQAAAG